MAMGPHDPLVRRRPTFLGAFAIIVGWTLLGILVGTLVTVAAVVVRLKAYPPDFEDGFSISPVLNLIVVSIFTVPIGLLAGVIFGVIRVGRQMGMTSRRNYR